MARKLLFIERDGGLTDRHPSGGTSATNAFPGLARGVIAALQRFRAAGFGLVVLDTAPDGNASPAGWTEARDGDAAVGGAAPGEDPLLALMASQGIEFEATLACTHAAGSCDCRLPGLGLVRDYLADATVDRRRSAVVANGAPGRTLAANMGLSGFIVGAETDWSAIAHALLDAPRTAHVERRTRETDITVDVDLDRAAEPTIRTGIGFFDHMLEQLGKHGGFALSVRCAGDLEVDEHHTVEDVALAIGAALAEALGDKRGIARYGFLLPMDEAEAQVALDLSGRAYFVFEGDFPREQVGTLPTELVPHFFRSLSDALAATLHISVRGENTHHMIETCFKGVARTFRQAFAREGSDLPSTKGQL